MSLPERAAVGRDALDAGGLGFVPQLRHVQRRSLARCGLAVRLLFARAVVLRPAAFLAGLFGFFVDAVFFGFLVLWATFFAAVLRRAVGLGGVAPPPVAAESQKRSSGDFSSAPTM